MVEILKKIFECNPEKSSIIIKDRCSDCGCEVIIEITSVSGGFGLQGGALNKSMHGGYFAKCSVCFKMNSKKVA